MAPRWATPCAAFCFRRCRVRPRRASRSPASQHEFSTIPGVKEDVTEIVLNIKGMIAKLHCDGLKTVDIDAAGRVRGYGRRHQVLIREVEILNPDHAHRHPGRRCAKPVHGDHARHRAAATFRPNATSNRLQTRHRRHSGGLDLYTSLQGQLYGGEYRVCADLTDYDKLTLEVWTDGTITAQRRGFAWRKGADETISTCSSTCPTRSATKIHGC